ncbi:MAG: hypothetical protein ACLUFN_04215 [Eubacterium sp.]
MKKAIKSLLCIFLCIGIIFSFAGCYGSTEMTEENVNAAVETVEKALQEFDTKTLGKYVESETLAYILNLADGHEQFSQLGAAIFKDLNMEVTAIDLEAKTVTVSVSNKDLYAIASGFTYELMGKYSGFQLLRMLDNDAFLDISLADLTEKIDAAVASTDNIEITLSISQGKHNLVLGFDEDAEDAVSGGALTAIKTAIGQ